MAILLGLHNGRDNLRAQLDSFAAQDHRNWSLHVSDDGEDDGGREIIRDFAGEQAGRDITVKTGPRQGFAMNFMSLIADTPSRADAVALSDQDDVWLPGKLSRALQMLQKTDAGIPSLYVGRTIICDAKLRPLRMSPNFTRAPDFRNAMVQSIGGGNTMVLNRAGVNLVRKVAPDTRQLVAHDWWLYQLVTGVGGAVIFDETPMVLYRQHGANLIGANDNPGASRRRLARIRDGAFQQWIGICIASMEAASPYLTDSAKRVLSQLEQARNGSAVQRIAALRRSGVHRQSRRDDLALYVSALLGKL